MAPQPAIWSLNLCWRFLHAKSGEWHSGKRVRWLSEELWPVTANSAVFSSDCAECRAFQICFSHAGERLDSWRWLHWQKSKALVCFSQLGFRAREWQAYKHALQLDMCPSKVLGVRGIRLAKVVSRTLFVMMRAKRQATMAASKCQ